MSESTTEQLTTAQEHMPQEVFYDLLNGVGNHEAKLLVAAIIASQPDYWFSVTRLKHELKSRQGEHPAWVQEPTTTFSYCQKSLEPIGAVVKGRIAGVHHEVDAYSTSYIGQKYGLAFAGEIMEWSLEHPEVSVQQILGSTSTSGAVRSPETRFHVFEAILTHPTENPSEKELIEGLSGLHSEKGLEHNLNFMRHYGLIEITSSVHEDFDPLITITRSALERNDYKISDGAKAVRSTINELYDQGATELTYSQFYRAAISANPEIDPLSIRESLVRGLNSAASSHPELKAIDRKGVIHDKSVVRLAPNTADAIEDLISRLEYLSDADADGLQSSRQKAFSIVNDSEKVRALMEKARIFSPTYRGAVEGGTQDLYDRILRVASAMGKTSNKEIRDQLKLEGRPLSQGRTSQILRALVSKGQLNKVTLQPDASRKRKTVIYKIAEVE